MAIYRHDSYVLDLSLPSNAKARVYCDGILIFQGSSAYAIPIFVKKCDDVLVTQKFYGNSTRQNLTNEL